RAHGNHRSWEAAINRVMQTGDKDRVKRSRFSFYARAVVEDINAYRMRKSHSGWVREDGNSSFSKRHLSTMYRCIGRLWTAFSRGYILSPLRGCETSGHHSFSRSKAGAYRC